MKLIVRASNLFLEESHLLKINHTLFWGNWETSGHANQVSVFNRLTALCLYFLVMEKWRDTSMSRTYLTDWYYILCKLKVIMCSQQEETHTAVAAVGQPSSQPSFPFPSLCWPLMTYTSYCLVTNWFLWNVSAWRKRPSKIHTKSSIPPQRRFWWQLENYMKRNIRLFSCEGKPLHRVPEMWNMLGLRTVICLRTG